MKRGESEDERRERMEGRLGKRVEQRSREAVQ